MNRAPLTIVFADISGSTRLFEQRGDEVAREMIQTLLSVCAEVVAAHHGEVVKTIGDEIMATFSCADQGVAAAIEMQRRISGEAVCRRERLALRIGLHHGDVLQEEHDVFGVAVNIAARMTSLAKREQIITTAESVRGLGPDTVRARSLGKARMPGKRQLLDIVDIVWKDDTTNVTSFQGPAALAETRHDTRLALDYRDHTVTLGEFSQPLVLGRDATADVVVEAEWVSRHHATLEYRRGFFVLADASTNGTFVYLDDDDAVFVHRDELLLRGAGSISLGQSRDLDAALVLHFNCS
ncbi:adenylate/guanylate cyclase domain-containing protein [Haliea sp. E1-2-M8]|uniref:adenylate/guanylate cyclase domain-containing protein n=1 Tax=Haliea sp. E1-2-M8 TaxID=3064706 RepID=UPI0027163DE1|nr:adenylate/guanylate cyclase domain-containing protein [Haliea sp. E1-2-M8]MDO8861810.1 adenylate/guanylate cyclase domain-containing protein [Haliea sp. E1-2-M8]